jgi:hypothetical protein
VLWCSTGIPSTVESVMFHRRGQLLVDEMVENLNCNLRDRVLTS